MTERQGGERLRCEWCGRPFRRPTPRGRPPRYCRRSCRQRYYEARRRAEDLGVADHELVLTRGELDTLHDRLFVLRCAVEDVERDVAEAESADDVARALQWLLDAARPLCDAPA